MKRSLRRGGATHKGDYGRVFVVAGSAGFTGAAYLASQAAVLGGAGLVTLGTPRAVYPILARKLTEAMVLPLPDSGRGALKKASLNPAVNFASKCDVVALGPGLSASPSARVFVRAFVLRVPRPFVIDADGLNCLAGSPRLIRRMARSPILTPHDGEFKRLAALTRVPTALSGRKAVAKKFSRDYDCVLVLKGHHTVVSDPTGRCYVNRTGNPGMASGGTGDVLTGLVAAFVAQGFEPYFASCLAVYAHGLAGDRAARHTGVTALKATDLLNALPGVLKILEMKKDLRPLLE